MTRRIFLGIAWLAAAPVWAQNPAATPQTPAAAFEQADKEADWREVFDGVGLKVQDWRTDGTVLFKDGHLQVGGPSTSTLQLKTPLGERFMILMECRNNGPQSLMFMLQTSDLLSKGASAGTMNLKPGEWTEVLIVGRIDEGGRVNVAKYYRNLADKSVTGGGGFFGGHGVPTVSFEVPPAGSLTIKKIRLQTTPPRSTSAGLYIALGVVFAVLVLIILAGWIMRRRATAPTPSSPRPPTL